MNWDPLKSCSGIWSCKQSTNNIWYGEVSAKLIQIVFSTLKGGQEKKKHKEREKEQAEAHKRKLSEMKQEEKRLHGRLDQLTSEHGAAKRAMQRAIRYVEEGGEKIKNALKVQDMMEVEAGYKLVEFGKEKQTQATNKVSDIMDERNKVEKELFKLTGGKKSKHNSLVASNQSFF